MKKALWVLAAVIVCSSMMFGQLRRGSFGLESRLDVSPVQGGNALSGLGVAYAVSENLRIDGVLGFNSGSVVTTGGTGATTVTQSGFGVLVGASYYIGTVDNVSAFAGGNVGFSSFSPGGGVSSVSNFTIGAFYGAEYWFSPKFAWSGAMGIQFTSVGTTPSTSTFGTYGAAASTGLTWWFN